jgi:cellulose synthase/poly-beta-1,6-N-acetylglucosamine synthase-like glycosyltransferase
MIIEVATWVMYFISTYFAVFLLLVVMDKGLQRKHPQGQWNPFVSIVIPAFNSESSIKKTLEHVLRLDYPHYKLEIVVVNDASTDGTLDVLKNMSFGDVAFKIINHAINKGKGAALNTALTVVKGDIFICLDDDSFVQPDALNKMLPYFAEDSEVASVLPFMKITKTNNILLKIQWVEYLMNFFLKKISSSINCIHVTPGPFGCYRTDILESVGGFDEHNLTEDLEMAMRLQHHQYKIVQLLDAEIYTVAPDTFKAFYNQRNRWYKGTLHNLYKYKHLLFNKNYGEFGIFHLPMVVAAAFLSLSFAFLILFYRLIKPALTKLYDLSFINFNVPLMTKIAAQRFSFLDFNYTMIYLTLIVFAFALLWIIGSHVHSKESYLKKGLTSSFYFLVFYPFVLSIIWLGVFFDLCRNKKQRW